MNLAEKMVNQQAEFSQQNIMGVVNGVLRHDWQLNEVMAIMNMPFMELLFNAQQIHREFFPGNRIQTSSLLSIKTGGCPEDCKYCPQSAHYDTGLPASKLMEKDDILTAAAAAKDAGATRFCMGAAWRSPKERDMSKLYDIIAGVKELGLESCATLGMLTAEQAKQLKEAGLDYYNHNLDSSEEFYDKIITTRSYQERLDTLENVRKSGMNVCCGGIIGMGETVEDRAQMLLILANLDEHPESVPINMLVPVAGTPLGDMAVDGKDDKSQANDNLDNSGGGVVDIFDFVRVIATARIMMPKSYVRLSAGRENMSEEGQALCFMAGANSIFYGDKLLTTDNPDVNDDMKMMAKLGLELETVI